MATPLPVIPPRATDCPLPGRDAQTCLAPLFLGTHGENAEVFERAHMRWRRGFHPEDPPSISLRDQREPSFGAEIARTEQAVRELSLRLQQSAPTFSPRYVGHMTSDLLLPGLLAHLATTLYNPNNVSPETSPITTKFEIEVGQQ